MVVLHARIFTHRKGVEQDHAFLINSMPGGVTERLEQLKIDETTTFRRVRRLIELTEDRGMMRRTPLFQELLFTMINSSNPHNYGKDLRYKYRFAVLKEHPAPGINELPTLIPVEHEQSDMPVLDYYRSQDLIIVPATQISPSGRCTPIPEQSREKLSTGQHPDGER
ncbi:unnamed protein product [Ectocarpus fasciculatus]